MASNNGEPTTPYSSRRKGLLVAVGALCHEAGFSTVEEKAIETLTEMAQSYLTELGRSAMAYTELAGRTEPMVSDCVMAMIDSGIKVDTLESYAKRTSKTVLFPPGHANNPNNPRSLQVGDKQDHPSHIPDYLPPFPDTHTYIKSACQKEPANEYWSVREKAATQKRDTERALTRFIAKTGETHALFRDDPDAFPLISCKPSVQPYLTALLPKDHDLHDIDETSVQNEQKEHKKRKSEHSSPGSSQELPSSQNTDSQQEDAETSDNPYLKPVKMPKKKTKY